MKRLLLGFALASAIAAACSSSDQSAPSLIAQDGGGGGTSGGPGPTGDGGGGNDATTGTDGDIPDTYAPPPVYVNSSHLTTQYGGQTRLYDLSIPVDYDSSKAYPVVMVFHGSPGTADAELAYAPFDPISKTSAIIIYPNALSASWDLTLSSTNADFGFTKAVLDVVAGQYNIDRSKVYGLGFSGGGFFVNMFSCTMPGTLRAFASHSGGAPYADINVNGQTYSGTDYVKCSDSETAVAAIIFHGMDDQVVEYGSGTFESQYWGYVNGCSDDTTAVSPAPCVTHNNCPANAPVELCGIPGLGHGIWAQGYATSWAFFLALP